MKFKKKFNVKKVHCFFLTITFSIFFNLNVFGQYAIDSLCSNDDNYSGIPYYTAWCSQLSPFYTRTLFFSADGVSYYDILLTFTSNSTTSDVMAIEVTYQTGSSFVGCGSGASSGGIPTTFSFHPMGPVLLAAGLYSYEVYGESGYMTSYKLCIIKYTPCAANITANGPVNFCSGANVVLSATAGAQSYQWRKNGINISGASSFSYAATQAGAYQCLITQSCGILYSNTISITVKSNPTAIISANGSTAFCPGGNVMLSAITGNGYTYQWKKNNVNIAGATVSTYTVNTGGNYKVVVTNNTGCSKASNSIVVVVNTPTATITPQGSTTFCSGSSVVLKANTGNGFTYQWKKGGANITNATDSTYTVATGGTYKVMVTNSCGSATSTGLIVTVNAVPSANITANGPTTFCNGSSVTINANTGTGLTYQWKKNNVDVSGASTSSYIATTTGSYTASITNSFGCTAVSNAISVTVNNITATITANGPTTFCAGGSVLLSANSGANRTYQWLKNNVNVSGATALSYLTTTAGNYKVIVTNTVNGCAKVSNVIQVIVNCKLGNLISEEINMQAFPNPTTGKVNLIFNSSSYVSGELIISDIQGQEIIKEQIPTVVGENDYAIDMKSFANGIYFVKLKVAFNQSVIRLIKE